MRRKDREMPRGFAERVFDKSMYATLATVGRDGTPYCIPISAVREDDKIYFHCAHEGHKIENMKGNAKVCVSCVGDTHIPDGKFTIEFESAVAFGEAKEITDEKEKIRALDLLCRRYTPENMGNFNEAVKESLNRTAVWEIEIEEMTGKRKKYDKAGIEMKFGRMK